LEPTLLSAHFTAMAIGNARYGDDMDTMDKVLELFEPVPKEDLWMSDETGQDLEGQLKWYMMEYDKQFRRIAELEGENAKLRAKDERITDSIIDLITSQTCKSHTDEIKAMGFPAFKAMDDEIGCKYCLEAELAKAREIVDEIMARGPIVTGEDARDYYEMAQQSLAG
jgi:hypothetical protein